MVTIDVSMEDMSELMGYNKTLTPEELDEHVAFAISEVDSDPVGPDENGHTKITIEIKTSNRPDLWSAEGIARLLKGRKGEPGLPDLSAEPSGYEIKVDQDLLEVRPYIAAAVVRGLELDDFLIKQMIQIQDKVDFSFGRRRKRTSIGIYNINMLETPIDYKLVERDFKFTPLQFEEELTVDEIFDQHPKGIEYRHILDEFDKVPMLIDKNDLVLSMPPIINSNTVGRVTEDTTDVLVETTGTNLDAVNVALSVVVQALRDRGGKIESVSISYPNNYELEKQITPETEPVEISVDPKEINTYLGTNLTPEKMVDLIKQRRNNALIDDGKITVKAAPWRKDILHWVDISEEVVIAMDYNTIGPTDAQVVTAGKLSPSTEDENMIRQIMIGLQLIEVMNYTLTDVENLSTMVRRQQNWVEENCVEISNPVNTSYNIVRSELLPGLIRFASKNTHVDYPQKIFETGEVVIKSEKVITENHVAVLLAGPNETFETILGILDTMFRLIRIDYDLEELKSNYYISGRSAKIKVDEVEVGHIGEIHPQIITNYGIEVPFVTFELDLTELPNLNIPKLLTDQLN